MVMQAGVAGSEQYVHPPRSVSHGEVTLEVYAMHVVLGRQLDTVQQPMSPVLSVKQVPVGQKKIADWS